MVPVAQERFSGVQIVRFVAAFLVVVCHSTLGVSERMPYLGSAVWEKGGIGVSIFFVISGFVIVLAGEPLSGKADGWRTFAYRRLLRIVPLYWIATTLKLSVVIAEPQQTLHSGLNWWHVTASYLFLPSRNPLGVVTPLHAVGWTLVFEMFFYGCFCAALFFRLRPVRFVATVFGLVILWAFIDPPFSQSWSSRIYGSPIVLEFLLGMSIGAAVRRGMRVPAAASLAAICIGVAMIWHFDVPEGWPAFFFHGIPSALVVGGVVFLEPWIARRQSGILLLLGASSYSLYLFHPFVIAGCAIAASRLHIASAAFTVASMTFLAILISVAIHLWVEVPVTRGLKRWIASPPEAAAVRRVAQ